MLPSVLFVSLLTVALPITAVSASSVGKSCAKAGAITGTKDNPLVCKKVGNKLIWQRDRATTTTVATKTTATVSLKNDWGNSSDGANYISGKVGSSRVSLKRSSGPTGDEGEATNLTFGTVGGSRVSLKDKFNVDSHEISGTVGGSRVSLTHSWRDGEDFSTISGTVGGLRLLLKVTAVYDDEFYLWGSNLSGTLGGSSISLTVESGYPRDFISGTATPEVAVIMAFEWYRG